MDISLHTIRPKVSRQPPKEVNLASEVIRCVSEGYKSVGSGFRAQGKHHFPECEALIANITFIGPWTCGKIFFGMMNLALQSGSPMDPSELDGECFLSDCIVSTVKFGGGSIMAWWLSFCGCKHELCDAYVDILDNAALPTQ
ncbi:hypothetical protein TNCV_4385161 [Trichonephila clavipes]|nr:hypothetical protein TNCV_4385161 [Trichonephila clavipes]